MLWLVPVLIGLSLRVIYSKTCKDISIRMVIKTSIGFLVADGEGVIDLLILAQGSFR